MRRCSVKPYEGMEKYIFVSYSHRDCNQVFEIIERMEQDGYRIWYDEGIEPGSEWSESIAQHLNGCALCIAFLSPRYLASINCKQEMLFALSKKKQMLSVVLEPIHLSLGMEMQLSHTQFIMKYTLGSDEEFFSKLYSAHSLEVCHVTPAPEEDEEIPEITDGPKLRLVPRSTGSPGGGFQQLTAAAFGTLLEERPELLDDVKALADTLHTAYPDEKENVNVIVTAYRAGIVSVLRENGKDDFPAEHVANFLRENYGIAGGKARWAAELWRDVFPSPKEETPDGAPSGINEAVWKGAHSGTPGAQYILGSCYYFGKGVPQDYREAIKWFWQAAKQGNAEAQYYLGDCYEHGSGIQRNITEAAKWFRSAAERGIVPAQANLGYCYMKGHGVKQDYKEAVKWLHMAAQKKNASAQYNLGECYGSGLGVGKNLEEAAKWWKAAAEQGVAAAQFKLGDCYSTGQGVLRRNPAEAVKWYQAAAQQGVVQAQRALGNCYYQGKGIRQDYALAAKWFQKAAEQGSVTAQANLGICYAHGHGVRRNYEEAVKWFQLAADQGVASAQTNLGLCYAQGHGVQQDHAKAVKWFRLAALQGDASAQTNLGICYMKGDGVPRNKREAEKWLHMAQEQKKP